MNTDMNDQNLHENLLNAGAKLAMPDKPSAAQRARWKNGALTESTNMRLVAEPRRRRRLFAMVGAGSLLAACVTLAVMFGEFGGPKRVEAAAIFASLREAMSRAFSLRLTNIQQDGIHVDGRMFVALPGEAVDDEAAEPGQVYFDLHVEADEGVEDIGGINADIALAAETGNEWVYIKMIQLPEELASQPLAAMLAPMAASGVVVDLNGMLMNHALVPTAQIEAISGDDANGSAEGDTHTLKLGFSLHGGAGPAPDGNEPQHGGHLSLLAMGHAGHSPAENENGDGNDPFEGGGSGLDLDMGGANFQVVEDFLRGLFAGDLTSEELEAMVSHLEQAAQNVQVNPLGNGEFSLIAGNFDHGDASLDAVEQAMLARLVVEIRYSDGTGVQWLELRNVGQEDGSIRFEMLPDGIDSTLLDRTRFTAGGTVMTIPLAGFANLIHGHGGNSGGENDNATQPDGDGQ